MTARGIGELDLRAAIEVAQGDGHGQGDASGIETRLQFSCELSRKQETARHPRALPTEELRHRLRAQLILVDERGDHARLVHGARCPPSRIGIEEPSLQSDSSCRLDHDGHLALAFTGPPCQPLESVHDLVVAIARLRHPQRKRREVHLAVGATPAQRGETRAEAAERDELDRHHRRTPAKGRTW